MQSRKFLRIYLRDQHALSAAFRGVAKRSHASNPEGDLGAVLADVESELEEDRRCLADVLTQLNITPNRFKTSLMKLAPKIGALKLNGNLVHYSPLSRAYELESLCVACVTRQHLWAALADLDLNPAAKKAVGARGEAAAALLRRLEPHRAAATAAAVAG